jgi:hypothetical protein
MTRFSNRALVAKRGIVGFLYTFWLLTGNLDAYSPSRILSQPCSWFGERGRLDRRFRRLAENISAGRKPTKW